MIHQWLFFIFCLVKIEALTKAGVLVAVHFKTEEATNTGIMFGEYVNSNHGFVSVKRIAPNSTIWKLSSILTDEYVEQLIEFLKTDFDVEAVEEQLLFNPTIY